MNTNEEKLQLKFDPRTIEHLGIKMYSQLPYALAELVANAYDAGASNANIFLYDYLFMIFSFLISTFGRKT